MKSALPQNGGKSAVEAYQLSAGMCRCCRGDALCQSAWSEGEELEQDDDEEVCSARWLGLVYKSIPACMCNSAGWLLHADR